MLGSKTYANTGYLSIIENFDERDVHKINGTDHTLDVDFIIEIKKRVIVENVEYLGLKLYTKELTKNREKRLNNKGFIKFSVSLLNSDEEIVAVKRTSFLEINVFKHGYGWNKFYKFDDLFREENKILENNSIRIY
jgi:hypothetical protein